jgi:hypothetical protein
MHIPKVIKEIVATIIVAGLLRWRLHAVHLDTAILEAGWQAETLLDVGIGASSAALVVSLGFARHLRFLWKIHRSLGRLPALFERTAMRDIENRISHFERHVLRPSLTHGAVLNQTDVDTLAAIVFESVQGNYYGVETSKPTVYVVRYPTYLERSRSNRAGPSARILVVSWHELYEDRQSNPDICNAFLDWHVNHQIHLLHVDPDTAEACRKQCKVDRIDVGVWTSKCAIEFHPLADGGTRVRIFLAPDATSDGYHNFVRALIEKARSIRIVRDNIELRELQDSERRSLLEPLLKARTEE